MQILTLLLFIPLAANWIAEWSALIPQLKYWLFYRRYTKITAYEDYSLKPLDCPKCLSVWLAWLYLLIQHQFTVESFIMSLAAGAIAFIINRIVNRI